MKRFLIAATLFVAGCVETTGPAPAPERTALATGPVTEATLSRVSSDLIPIAVRECERRSSGLNCNFQVGVDRDPDQPPNAFQTIGKDGRPLLIFNVAILADLRNQDELAFILGHEAAHHIEGHLAQTNTNATVGGLLGGLAAVALGVDPGIVDTATRAGAVVGSRAFSKDFELEADSTGAIITKRAGYDPVRGAAYFTRIDDPGNKFLGTHPPNADRIATVRGAVAGL